MDEEEVTRGHAETYIGPCQASKILDKGLQTKFEIR